MIKWFFFDRIYSECDNFTMFIPRLIAILPIIFIITPITHDCIFSRNETAQPMHGGDGAVPAGSLRLAGPSDPRLMLTLCIRMIQRYRRGSVSRYGGLTSWHRYCLTVMYCAGRPFREPMTVACEQPSFFFS